MSIKRGALIVLEGVDRSGKSTQCKRLVDSLKNMGLKAQLMVFPDRSTLTGQLISSYLKDKSCNLNDKAIHLLFSANRWENYEKMETLLTQGVSLIVDRYSYSGIAYSTIKRNMDLEWCMKPEEGLIKPDLVFLLTLADNELSGRPGFGDERYENPATQKKVKDVFRRFAEVEDNWKIVSASGTIDEVHQVLLKDVVTKIEEVETVPLNSMAFGGKLKQFLK